MAWEATRTRTRIIKESAPKYTYEELALQERYRTLRVRKNSQLQESLESEILISTETPTSSFSGPSRSKSPLKGQSIPLRHVQSTLEEAKRKFVGNRDSSGALIGGKRIRPKDELEDVKFWEQKRTPSSGFKRPVQKRIRLKTGSNIIEDEDEEMPSYQSPMPVVPHSTLEHTLNSANTYSGTQMVNLFVGNLPETITQDRIRELFSPWGTITSIRHLEDRRIAFVRFTDSQDAETAIKELHGVEIDGYHLKVDISKPRSPHCSKKSSPKKSHVDEQDTIEESSFDDLLKTGDV
eukprot:256682_1